MPKPSRASELEGLLRRLLDTAEGLNGSLDYADSLLRPWEDAPPEPEIFAEVRRVLEEKTHV